MKFTRFFKKRTFCVCLSAVFFCFAVQGLENKLPEGWQSLEPIIKARVSQEKPKMKLTQTQADSLNIFLTHLKGNTAELEKLQFILPKTTVELLMAVHVRNVPIEEAEKMATYLRTLVRRFQFQNPHAFDENTSHIIGREWNEIDYSGENMTWQKQRLKYLPYKILNFKSVRMLQKFFPVEAKLPYFNKLYRPKNPKTFDPFDSLEHKIEIKKSHRLKEKE